jgi:hypothetical protein
VPNSRDALKGLGALGATVLLRIDAGAQGEDLVVAGKPVELRIASVSPLEVRVVGQKTVHREKLSGRRLVIPLGS